MTFNVLGSSQYRRGIVAAKLSHTHKDAHTARESQKSRQQRHIEWWMVEHCSYLHDQRSVVNVLLKHFLSVRWTLCKQATVQHRRVAKVCAVPTREHTERQLRLVHLRMHYSSPYMQTRVIGIPLNPCILHRCKAASANCTKEHKEGTYHRRDDALGGSDRMEEVVAAQLLRHGADAIRWRHRHCVSAS